MKSAPSQFTFLRQSRKKRRSAGEHDVRHRGQPAQLLDMEGGRRTGNQAIQQMLKNSPIFNCIGFIAATVETSCHASVPI